MQMNIDDMVGKIFKTQDESSLKVFSVSGRDSVNALCTRCKQIDVYRASMLRNGKTKVCKKCEKLYKHKSGETVGTYKILNRLASIPTKYKMITFMEVPVKEIFFGYKVHCEKCGNKFNILDKDINIKCKCQVNNDNTKNKYFDLHGIDITTPEFDRAGKKVIRK